MDQHQQILQGASTLSQELNKAAQERNERLEKSLRELRESRKRNDLQQARIEEEVRIMADEVDRAAIDLIKTIEENRI